MGCGSDTAGINGDFYERGKKMGAIIRMFKMPEKCSECPFADDEIRFCRLRNSPIIAGKTRDIRMPLCPLINEGEYMSNMLKNRIMRLLTGKKNRSYAKEVAESGKCALAGFRDGIMASKVEKALLEIHNIGGCDAEDEYAQGWDAAIDEVIRIIEKETSIRIADVLD